jgi:hypothetical protein
MRVECWLIVAAAAAPVNAGTAYASGAASLRFMSISLAQLTM